MVSQSNRKVVVSFVVGFALVISAYILNSTPENTPAPTGTLSVVTPEVSLRNPIPVTDSNNDGIEDWQETFLAPSILVSSVIGADDYEDPKTLTEQVGIEFFEDMVRAKGFGPFGQAQEEMITETLANLSAYTTDKIYNVNDIIILTGPITSDDIRLYANAHANAIIYSDKPGTRPPLEMVRDIVAGRSGKVEELESLADVYLKTLEAALKIPVPASLTKEHLDLINVYNALYNDLLGMSKTLEDPMISLLRLKRYPEDSAALRITLENMFFALKPYMGDFTATDNGFYFALFNPDDPYSIDKIKQIKR